MHSQPRSQRPHQMVHLSRSMSPHRHATTAQSARSTEGSLLVPCILWAWNHVHRNSVRRSGLPALRALGLCQPSLPPSSERVCRAQGDGVCSGHGPEPQEDHCAAALSPLTRLPKLTPRPSGALRPCTRGHAPQILFLSCSSVTVCL